MEVMPLIQMNPSIGSRYYLNELKPHYKYASVTSILEATQTENQKKSIAMWRKKIRKEGGNPKEELDKAAKRGTDIHNFTELFLQGEKPPVPKEYENWCDYVIKSPIWQYVDEIVCTERKVFSDQGLHPFAGTFDALLKINGELVLFDLKTKGADKGTPMKSICNEALCQMQAYRLCLKENYDIDVTRFIALYVFPDQPTYPIYASGPSLKQHEEHWEKRLKTYVEQKNG